MKPIIAAPLVAIMLAGAGVGAYYATAGAGSGEEAPVAQATSTPTPTPAEQPTATAASTIAPTPTPTPTPEPTATAQSTDWLTYSDPDFGFSIDYPPQFVIEILEAKGGDLPGILKLIRAVDAAFTAGYPPGQVEFGVYAKDANTLSEWLSKHSDTALSPSRPTYHHVTNTVEATAAAQPTLSFDSLAGEAGTVHSTVFFFGANVFVIDWFASDPTYESTIQPIFERMLGSFRE
jgi:hypothetical protein